MMIIGGLLLLLWPFLFGCTSKGENGCPADGPKPLRIGTTMSIKQANPVADYYYNILAMLMTHDSLVRFDEGLNPVPQLAVKFGSDTEGRVWTFDLAPDARWHDGRPVTPDDVAFTFEYIGKHHVSGGWISDIVEKTETSGRRVTFRLKRPYSRFLINAGFVVRILPRHIWETISDPYQTQSSGITVGCGPYRFDGFDRSAGLIRFQSNTGYYGQVPRTARVAYRTYGTMDLLALDMIRGQVDLYYQYAAGMPAPYVEKLGNQPRLACLETMSMGVPAVLGFNLDRPLVRSLAMRQAIALAIDYSQVNACLMNGKGMIPSPGLVPPSFPFHAGLDPWSRDVEKSRALLSSQWLVRGEKDAMLETADGEPVTLTLLVRSDLWGEGQIVKLLARDLNGVGIKLTVRSADLSTYLAFLKEGDYDLVLFRTTPWGMMMHAGCGSGYFDSRTTGSLNMCRLKDVQFSHLCDRILATTESKTLETLYGRVQQYYAEHLPAVALCWGRSIFPYARDWQGFKINQLEGGLANRFSWAGLEPPEPGRMEAQ
jgi:peptide/nickel transport system substrate-binding protein